MLCLTNYRHPVPIIGIPYISLYQFIGQFSNFRLYLKFDQAPQAKVGIGLKIRMPRVSVANLVLQL